jgi:deoxycytidine triphosphate deaminase
MDLTRYPLTPEEATERADLYENDDPFKSIPRALLSSVEIDDYARVTGMLHPFDRDQLKSASYEVYIGGEVIWWDGKGDKHKRIVKKGDQLTLPANSIVFAQVEPIFLLPNYVAIRFNLRISHVQRGLLLGTGPLVDPGFRGKLLIPLHNLTSSDYDINTNDALIWIEFTKTSHGCDPIEELAAKPREFIGFPKNKRWLEPEDYLRKANGPNPIRSSIPDAIRNAAGSAAEAQKSAAASESTTQRIRRRINTLGIATAIVSLLVALLTIAGLGIGLYQIGQQVGQMVQNAQSLVATVQQTVGPEAKANVEKTVQSQATIEKLSNRVDALTAEIEQIKKSAPNAAGAR